jgi:hypothetical protein
MTWDIILTLEEIKMNTPLQEWFMANLPNDEMLWKKGMERQVIFIRDTITKAFPLKSYEEFKAFKDSIMVISTHTSKSISLPVYELNWKGFIFVLRYNFYDWKVSCDCPMLLDIDFKSLNLFKVDAVINPVYCEGFSEFWVYDSYQNNKQKFTVEIQSYYDLYCFFKILTHRIGG